MEIINDEHAPLMKYPKTFLKAYLVGAIYGITYFSISGRNGLANTLRRTNTDYTKISPRFEYVTALFKKAKPGILGFAALVTVFRILGDQLV